MRSSVGAAVAALLVSVVIPMGARAAVPAGDPVVLPGANASWDYQISGGFKPADGVQMVSRDRTDTPAPGLYNICYVNGFQAQPNEMRFWHKHWWLILKKNGKPVVDEGWNEKLLDIRTPKKRKALADIVGRWVTGCARDGFDAVEFDNLDSFSRSRGLISRDDSKRFATALIKRSHRAGLAAGQKNWAEMDGSKLGFDFAIAEECQQWKECGSYVGYYGDLVFDVEYKAKFFSQACRVWGDELGIILRDRDVSPDGVNKRC